MSAGGGVRYRPRPPFPPRRRQIIRFSAVRRSVLVPALLAAVAASCGVAAADELPPTAAVGVGGFVRPGAWAPLSAPGGVMAAAVVDGDGLTVARTFTRTISDAPPVVLIQAGRAESPVTVTTEGTEVVLVPGVDFTPLSPRDRLWAAVNLPREAVGGAGMNGSRDGGRENGPYGFPVRVAEFAAAADLPAVPGGLSSVRVILAEAGSGLSGEVADRLGDWVAGGGHLVLSADPAGGPLPDFVPVEAGEPEPLTAYSALEALAGRGGGSGGAARLNQLVPATVRPVDPAAVAAADGRVLARGDGGAIVCEVPVGFGRVTVCSVSLHAAPLATWGGLPEFLRELTRRGPARATADPPRGGRELAEQLSDAAEPAGGGWSPGAVGLLVLGAVLLLGPVDWFLCHRVLKRPAATWATLPVWLAAIGGAAWWAAAGGEVAGPSRVEIVDLDAATGRVRGAAWATVPAPAGGRADVRLTSAGAFGGRVEARLGFAADPSAEFGGLFRGGAAGAVPAGYVIEGVTARGVPLPEGAAASVRLDWSATGADVPVFSSLRESGGRLRGAVAHRLPGRLEDAILVHGGRVYRPDPAAGDGALDPCEPFRPDAPGARQRDLVGFLTQTRVTAEADPGDDEVRERTTVSRYDPAGRDFAAVLPVLSFFERAGGTGYTGLTNAELEPLDLSAVAASGRAVLIGRLDDPLTDLAVDFGDVAVPAGRSVTLVRVLLPVPDGPAAAPAGPAGPVGPARAGPPKNAANQP